MFRQIKNFNKDESKENKTKSWHFHWVALFSGLVIDFTWDWKNLLHCILLEALEFTWLFSFPLHAILSLSLAGGCVDTLKRRRRRKFTCEKKGINFGLAPLEMAKLHCTKSFFSAFSTGKSAVVCWNFSLNSGLSGKSSKAFVSEITFHASEKTCAELELFLQNRKVAYDDIL